ncbi:hypothetical protein FHR70_003773 [Microvirga lupini]|uniref:Uncharacterized protein n=1 Tax=Microvirga lupini TaxID=420324 RepID=A0A7W4VPV0_9HYPH|nr:hypothetical protein [Microvirga lupini]
MPRSRLKPRYRFTASGRWLFLSHDGFIPHSPSIGKTASSPGADVKSAGGSTEPLAARAFVSAPASTLGNIAQPRPAIISNR